MHYDKNNHAKKIDKLLEISYKLDNHDFRNSVITDDEITDLIILLNTEDDFDKLLQEL